MEKIFKWYLSKQYNNRERDKLCNKKAVTEPYIDMLLYICDLRSENLKTRNQYIGV